MVGSRRSENCRTLFLAQGYMRIIGGVKVPAKTLR